ncbi:MAG: LysM domain-containing protein, partial [Verrucomicrobia bacterium]|nr:LysM domain-containing protein [Verrucomicrobiota bacterium]
MSSSRPSAYHVLVSSLGGIFTQIIPNPAHITNGQPDNDFTHMLDAAEMPDIDPGEKAFQKAHELLALGKLPEAREKLTAIVNIFPASSSAPVARRIVGEMNLDEILSTSHMEGKQIHVVKRGDSLLAIAAQYKTTIDCIMYLNAMMELRRIHPGDELVVMPLELRLLIEPQRKSLSLWDGGRFIREYPILHLGALARTPPKTTISSKSAEIDGRRVQSQSKDY